jgi:hypothetical protein
MKYKIVDNLKIKTSQGEMILQTGQVINIQPERAIKLINKGKIKPLRDIFEERYRELCRWLKSYPVIAEEIKEYSPELYQSIQDAIEDMDSYFLTENLQGFTKAMEKVKKLYLEAVNSIKKQGLEL